jgi:tetratricopeptide (TPR) repeat protein
LIIFSGLAMIPGAYADLQFSKTGGLFRLKAESSEKPQVLVERTARQGGLCESKATQDLVLIFNNKPSSFISEGADAQALTSKDPSKGPCFVQARLRNDSKYEFRLSYLQKAPLQHLAMQFGKSLVVDHWFGEKFQKRERRLSKGAKAPLDAPSFTTLARGEGEQLTWKEILGITGNAVDLNSPELDKYRSQAKERDLGVEKDFIERKSLQIPVFDYPVFLFGFEFDSKTFKPKSFQKVGSREQMLLAEGMNYVKVLVERKDWLRADKSFEITKKSAAAKLVSGDDPYFVALDGYIKVRLGEELKREDLYARGLETWAEGLRKTVKRGLEDDEYVLFMLEEFLRRSLAAKDYFQLAEFIAWTESFIWAPAVLEKIHFLKAESFFHLKLFDEAGELFEKFARDREGVTAQQIYQRDFLISALFRKGDILSLKRDWKGSVAAYSQAFQKLPGAGKFSFEGSWYPKDVARYPEILLNRAQAYYYQGMESAALRDYRAFIFTNGNHKYVSLAMFKIAEILLRIGAEREKIVGTLSECVFKKENTIGAQLCRARKASLEMESAPEKDLGRLLGFIEDLHDPTKNFESKGLFKAENLDVYSRLLWAHPFLARNKAHQALTALESNVKLEASYYLKSWNFEYLVTALSGHLEDLLSKKKNQEVVENYEKRKRNELWKSTRGEILWRVAAAFGDMELWEQSSSTWKEAEKIRKIIDRREPRPFDVDANRWYLLAIRADIPLAKEKKIAWEAVEGNLAKLDMNKEESLRAWVDYELARERDAKTLAYWKKIQQNFRLTWSDLALWQRSLEKLGKSKERLSLLEESVGLWFAGNRKGDGPPADLILALAESRARERAYEKSLLVYDFLLTEPMGLSRAMLHYQKAKVLQQMGKADLANKSFSEVIQSEPDSLWAKLSQSEGK